MTTVAVQIPSTLRHECGGRARLDVSASTVREALDRLAQQEPALYRCVCDETGNVRRHMNLFIASTLLACPEELDTALEPGDVLSIMTAVSGG
ncbi:MAG: MoaD/ThiS family protein [Planctomycetales bacterium]|nr:MoaD/ThiS family protein [Planctomycetales bacterium]